MHHPKILKLRRRLGDKAFISLLYLWAFAGEYRQKGILTKMNAEDIEIAAKWEGEENSFFNTLLDVGLLDKFKNGLYKIHDWKDHNSYLYYAPERSQQAKRAARAKWEQDTKNTTGDVKKRVKTKTAKGDNELSVCPKPKSAMPKTKISNAPSPIPSPNPKPFPTPNPSFVSASQKPKSEGTDTTQIKKYFRQKYQDKYGVDYDFKGAKDAQIIKRLLKTYGLEKLKELTDSFYNTQIKFILDKGHSWGMFSSMLTQLLAEIRNNNSPLMQLSEAGQRTAENARSWLADKEREIENEE